MPPPSRTRRMLKWTGAGLCALTISAYAFSYHSSVRYVSPGRRWDITAANGAINIYWGSTGAMTTNVMGWEFKSWPRQYVKWQTLMELEVPGSAAFAMTGQQTGDARRYIAPYWLLLLGTSIPTAWLFYRDRRRIRPSHCRRCGYDLTGNTSGVCSECGKPAAAAAEKPGR